MKSLCQSVEISSEYYKTDARIVEKKLLKKDHNHLKTLWIISFCPNLLTDYNTSCLYMKFIFAVKVRSNPPLREKWSFFLVRIFLYLDLVRRFKISLFCANTGKYGPEKTPYLDTFHTVLVYFSCNQLWSWYNLSFTFIVFVVNFEHISHLLLVFLLLTLSR